MYQVTVVYDHPEDPAAFESHYSGTHIPLARAVPGLTGYTLTYCEPGPDGSRPRYHAIAALTWASKDDALAALGSPEMKAAADDLPNFASAGAALIFGSTESAL